MAACSLCLVRRTASTLRAVVHGAAGDDFVATEETLCYLIPRDLLLGLIRRNPAFAAFFYADVSRKLAAFAEARQAEGVESVLRSRIRDARFGAAVFIEADATIEEAGRTMHDNNINALYVRDGERIGVVTGMNLSKAVVLRRLALDTPLSEVCHFDVVAIDADDFIFDALLLMTKQDKRRLAVRRDGVYVGFLEDIDLTWAFCWQLATDSGPDRARSQPRRSCGAGAGYPGTSRAIATSKVSRSTSSLTLPPT